MSGTDFSRIDRLFAAALDRPTAERDAFLRDACGSDEELYEQVRALLAHDRDPHGVFARDATELTARVVFEHLDQPSELPERIGGYRILRRLGEGAMGVVYLAEQEQTERRVAVKVLRASLATTSRRRRFQLEAHLLARLQHPGIAQIYDAGSHDFGDGARPYFAMEYVDGAPATAFVRDRNLSVVDRVRLMIAICDAVHHAHQRGVIHRDLKPANVLVRAAGSDSSAAFPMSSTSTRSAGLAATPKVLDFGIARFVGDDIADSSMHTQVGQLVGTLPYMSPEQVAGDPSEVDVRSDVYALGVLFFEMLTGRAPYDVAGRSMPAVARTIAETEPSSLGRVDRALRGDLDAVCSKALRKDKQQRYQSAAQFAEDLERYLNDQPVLARRPSVAYQLRKFARRNPSLVAAALLLLAILVASSIVSTSLFLRADRESKLKDAQAMLARENQQKAEGHRREAEQQSYIANVAAAEGAIREGDAAEARRRLDAAPEYLRGWEWRHLNARLDRSVTTFDARAAVKALAFDAAGQTVFAVDDAGDLVRFDAESGRPLNSAAAHGGWIHDLALDPPRRRIATCGHDGFVRIWSADDLTRRHDIELPGAAPESLRWSTDGRTIVVGKRDGEVLQLTPDGVVVRRFQHDGGVRAVRTTDDGERLIVLDQSGAAVIRNLQTGEEVRRVEWGGVAESRLAVLGPAGRVIAFGDYTGLVSVFDTESGKAIDQFHAHDGFCTALAFSPDGSTLATGGHDARVRIWDTEHYRLTTEFIDHAGAIRCLAFNGDGSRLTSGASDASARIWATDASAPDRLTGHEQWVYSLDLFDDGRALVAADGRRGLRVWSIATGNETDETPGDQEHIAFAVRAIDDGARIVFLRGERIGVWDRSTGATTEIATGSHIADLAVAADETWAAAVHFDGATVDLIDLERGAIIRTFDWGADRTIDGNLMRTVAIDADNRTVIASDGAYLHFHHRTSGAARTINLRDAGGQERWISTLEPFSDGSRLAIGSNGSVLILDRATFEIAAELEAGAATNRITDIIFSRDGSRMFAGDVRGELRIWTLPDLRRVATFSIHSQQIKAIDISEDDQVLVTGSIDRTVRVLRAPRPDRD